MRVKYKSEDGEADLSGVAPAIQNVSLPYSVMFPKSPAQSANHHTFFRKQTKKAKLPTHAQLKNAVLRSRVHLI